MYKFVLLVLSGAILGIILVIPPINFLVVLVLIGLMGALTYVGLFLTVQKKRTAALGGMYVAGLLLLRALGVLDVLNFVLISAVVASLVIFFHQK